MAEKNFVPEWTNEQPPKGSYRSILKWGAADIFKHPNARLFDLMKKTFHLTDEYFQQKKYEGNETVSFDIPPRLSKTQIQTLTKIVGEENAAMDDYSRLTAAYGKTMLDLMRLRANIAENVPDLVLKPRSKDDIRQIVQYCHKQKIAIYVFGGRSSVVRGTEAVLGGVSLDMTAHMKRILNFNEMNQTIQVEPGIYGPELEEILNNAKEGLQAKRGYTCGHFPQSFEYSTVGGWIAALGSGQQSTYYGDMKDLVIAQEYITPAGDIVCKEFPASATGPAMNDIVMGSEGAFGVMVSATIKIFRYLPQNAKKFSYIFKNYEEGLQAVREISQAEFGKPSVFRLSDPEETDVALKLYGVEGTLIDRWINLRGYKPMERCLLIGQADGHRDFTEVVKKNVHKVCKRYNGLYTTGFVVDSWAKGRYKDPYMREDLQDFGIMIDTLECTVRWDNLRQVHQGVRDFIKKRPDTICMTHSSHFYEQGTNLYFIFIAKMDQIPEYQKFQSGIVDAIYRLGGSLSHHHGIGKMIAPWFAEYLGATEMGLLKAIKQYLDPQNIMNPGGTFALDQMSTKISGTETKSRTKKEVKKTVGKKAPSTKGVKAAKTAKKATPKAKAKTTRKKTTK